MDQLIYTSRWRRHVSETVGDLRQEILRVSEIDIVVVSLLTISSSDLGTSHVRRHSSRKTQLKSGGLQCEYS